jgi:hypothetical protein
VKLKSGFVVVVFVASCAAPGRTPGDGSSRTDLAPGVGGGGGEDLAQPADLGGVDVDLKGADLKAPPDLKPLADLATPPDLTALPDLATPPDLATFGDGMICTPPVAGSPCDTAPQCGCSGGLNCSVVTYSTGATGCVATGTTPNYHGCSGNGAGQCGIGAACVDGVCASYCETISDCPGAYRDCGQVSSGGTAIPGFKTCTRLCDPVSPQLDNSTYDACGPQVNCMPASDRVSSCTGPTTASGTRDANCLTGSDPDQSKCAPGFVCLFGDPFGFFAFCYKFCHAGSDADCAGNGSSTKCFSFNTKQYAGLSEVGYCDVP